MHAMWTSYHYDSFMDQQIHDVVVARNGKCVLGRVRIMGVVDSAGGFIAVVKYVCSRFTQRRCASGVI